MPADAAEAVTRAPWCCNPNPRLGRDGGCPNEASSSSKTTRAQQAASKPAVMLQLGILSGARRETPELALCRATSLDYRSCNHRAADSGAPRLQTGTQNAGMTQKEHPRSAKLRLDN